MKSVPFLLWIFALLVAVEISAAERCPLFFGEFECPKDFNCVLGTCKNQKDEMPSGDCSKIQCNVDSICVEGKCLPAEGLPCGRNVLIGENSAKAIVGTCGWRGKCINGKCAIDRCFEKLCNDDEICRDGTCTRIVDAFCWGNFDCGSNRRCVANKCVVHPDSLVEILTTPKCDPGEIFKDRKCQKNEGCASVVCDVGDTCVEGVCIPYAVECKTEKCPRGMICENGLCAVDPCVLKECPQDHACLLGECRLIEGMLCQETCQDPFVCHNGICKKNGCRRKVCQIGEVCDNSLCIRIEGKLCTLAARDCGDGFLCQNGQCKDTIQPINTPADIGQIVKI